MAQKGLDSNFMHYGIRAMDLKIIENLCEEKDIDFEWLKEYIFKALQTERTSDNEIEEKDIQKIINNALRKLN